MSTEIKIPPSGMQSPIYKQPIAQSTTQVPAGGQFQAGIEPENKVKKQMSGKLKSTMFIAGAIALIALITKYNKGVSAIKLKETTFGNATSLDSFIKNGNIEEGQRAGLEAIWNQGKKAQDGITGKIHKAMTSVGEFFKKNFYNY